MLKRLLENHVFANTAFAVVLIVGTLSFLTIPRAKDPEVNFNWISIMTSLPGAAAEDVEKLITDPIEDSIAQVQDVNFISSNSREGLSSILVRFGDISSRTFDKRINDLRREIQNKANAELPSEANEPMILEITTSNSFPTATVAVWGQADDEVLRRTALSIKEDLLRLKGVEDMDTAGLRDPEIHVDFDPARLQSFGITPSQLADAVGAHFRDVSAGNASIGGQEWLVRLIGKNSDPGYIARLPISTARGDTPVGSVADVSRARKKATTRVSYKGSPAVLLAVKKKAHVNTLDMVARINSYIADKNAVIGQLGIQAVLIDDQTAPTRDALQVMETNALFGLALVMLVTWIFLGLHIAVFIGIGIPFTLAGLFWFLNSAGYTLNQSVLLGVVIVLGMLVDDAVVVVEDIYYRLQRGVAGLPAALAALREVFSPVTASVLTTVAAFLPLMLLPGILGDFMFIIPFVVTTALLLSLLEAYWMLPVHVIASKVRFDKPSRIHSLRVRFTHWIRVKYGTLLIRSLRRPKSMMAALFGLLVVAVSLVATGKVRTEFFAFDPLQIFYVNVRMPPGTPLDETLRQLSVLEGKVREHMRPGEAREIASAAGQMFTETEPFFGDHYGQITVSLYPRTPERRRVAEIVDQMRNDVINTPGPSNIAFMIMSGGPPVMKPISVKVRGDDFSEIRSATDALWKYLETVKSVHDISDDDSPGKNELRLALNADAIKRAGLNAADVARTVRLLFDGEVVASMQDEGEKVELRVRAQPRVVQDTEELLRTQISLPGGGAVPLGQLVHKETGSGKSNIRHYNFRRAITLEANLHKEQMDTVEANNLIKAHWAKIREQFPNVDLDFSGELDDLEESLNAIAVLFVFGIGLIYMILGAQFGSYFQPLMILTTVPMAFIGVVFGLFFGNDPLSLFTLYGVVALGGVAVNSAIVMIDAANTRLAQGMSVLHSIVYAARRRVIPILITSLTTIAGLFSLATGLGGESLLWGPVASAIVWGLAVSTVLTLFFIPMFYRTFMRPRHALKRAHHTE